MDMGCGLPLLKSVRKGNSMIKNAALILFGWFMCVTTIILGWLLPRLAESYDTPWSDGLILNVLKAAKKYSTKSWLMRMKGIWRNPRLTLQYLEILGNQQLLRRGPYFLYRRVRDLTPSHDVDTTTDFHRKRVDLAKKGIEVGSEFGDVIVVGDQIHDGHHRVAAHKEAGLEYIKVKQYW